MKLDRQLEIFGGSHDRELEAFKAPQETVVPSETTEQVEKGDSSQIEYENETRAMERYLADTGRSEAFMFDLREEFNFTSFYEQGAKATVERLNERFGFPIATYEPSQYPHPTKGAFWRVVMKNEQQIKEDLQKRMKSEQISQFDKAA